MSDTLTDIADASEALCDPHHHTEHLDRLDRNGKPDKHPTTVPGLIQQLRDHAEPGSDGQAGGKGGPESVPVAIDAVSLLASIGYGAAKRVLDAAASGIRIDMRDTPEGNLRALVGIAGQFPHSRTRVDQHECPGCLNAGRGRRFEHWAPCHVCQPTTQVELLAELRSWRGQADIITGWKAAPVPLIAPCPACDARGTLLAFPADTAARCNGCGQEWADEPTERQGAIGVLTRHIAIYHERAEQERRIARQAAVQARRRSEGKLPAEAA